MAETYEGNPCSSCGGTLRYASRDCVACSRARRVKDRSPAAQEANRQRQREWYERLSGLAYNRRLLAHRRYMALQRMKRRSESEGRTP